ncbi:MAG: branched-chain amino acid ABC transporter ATP-binding protein/permease [Betaproteobacteria bacterium]
MNKTFFGILGAGALLAVVPWLGLPAFYESFLYLICHWVILAMSWNILSGYSGYFSFGHGVFYGVGMYTTAALAGKLDWPFLSTLPLAALLPAVLGVLLGAVVFRVKSVRGELFALLTLAVTFVVATIIINTPIDGGPGVYLMSVEVPKIGPSPSSSLYLMALMVAILTALIAYQLQRSKLGVGLSAIHDDEDVAEVMGVPTYRYKLVAFAISSALAGLAGGIHALFVQYVTVGETFNITVPLTVVLMSCLGGSRHWAGPAVGAALITTMMYAATAGNNPVLGKALGGVVLIVVILFMPNGVMGYFMKRRAQAAARRSRELEQRLVAAAPGAPMAAVVSADAAPPAAIEAGQVLLSTSGLSKAFKGVQALSEVDLQVYKGEILGLLGPNGSGKSTFINVVSGHYPATGGTYAFEGRELVGKAAHEVAQSGIARTYQIPRPFMNMTVLENVILSAMFGGAAMGRVRATEEARRCLEFTGLAHKAESLPDDLNLHQRKFLELARALAARPRLVLLDEVLSGMTPSEIDEAIVLIRRIRDQGSTIVFVEHVMRAVMALCDRVAVLNHGKLLAVGPAKQVMSDPQVVSAYLGKPHA